jgi:D-alanyl-D-alanine carboxypeptidase (penicillin-binding protein 5/6)
MKRKLLPALLIIAMVVLTGCGNVSGKDKAAFQKLDLSSKYLIVYNYTDDVTMYAKNANSRTAPASLVKLMVILLAVENTGDLDTRVATSASDYKYTRAVVESDSNEFVSGEKATIRDYLYAMMFHSSADASMTVLRYLGNGKMGTGVKMMNAKAKELGMNDTNFEDAIGDDKNSVYTTCSDMAKLMNYALNNDTFKTILTASVYTIKADNKRSSDTKISSSLLYHAGSDTLIQGGKLGFTPKALKAIASYAKIDGKEYFVISTEALATPKHQYPNITDSEKIYETIKNDL